MSPQRFRPRGRAAGLSPDYPAAVGLAGVASPTRRGFLAVAGGAVLSGCVSTAPDAHYPAKLVEINSGEAVRLVSVYRVQHGLNGLTQDGRLTEAARAQALAMAQIGRMSHDIAGQGTLPRRLERVGYNWGVSAENLGAGYPTLKAAFDGWVHSPKHNENLLRKGLTEMGIAAASSPSRYGTFWALILSSPRQMPEEEPDTVWWTQT